MVDDQQVAETAQPVREYHSSGRDRLDFLSGLGGNEEPLPYRSTIGARAAEAARQLALHGEGEAAPQLAEGACAGRAIRQALVTQVRSRAGLTRHQPCEALHQLRETILVALERADLAPPLLNVARDLRERYAARGF